MDFIARAGSLIDRGHRIIGILLVIVVVQFLWVQSVREEKAVLQRQINIMNKTQSIYVVPNSQAAVYKPASSELLLSTFVDFVSQSLLTYTHANLEDQYKSVSKFMSPKLLELSTKVYLDEIKKSKREGISSLFIADRTSTELSEFKETGKVDRYGHRTYEVILKGKRHFIMGGVVTETKNMEIVMHLKETTASEVNPFGFEITRFAQQKTR